jgi:hypothetical protein
LPKLVDFRSQVAEFATQLPDFLGESADLVEGAGFALFADVLADFVAPGISVLAVLGLLAPRCRLKDLAMTLDLSFQIDCDLFESFGLFVESGCVQVSNGHSQMLQPRLLGTIKLRML